MRTHILGFPRIGGNRELKKAVEDYWKGAATRQQLEDAARAIRLRNWTLQRDAGIDVAPVGDFALYDHILDAALLLGVVPSRFRDGDAPRDIDLMFRMARGQGGDHPVAPLEMTKWFDTNYHYLVPELDADTTFAADAAPLLAQIDEAQAAGFTPKAVLPGPMTFLWLSKRVDGGTRWSLLPALLDAYGALLRQVAARCPMIQLDEPIVSLDLPDDIRSRFVPAYARLRMAAPDATLLLASYFAPVGDNLATALSLPVDVLHLDLVRGPEDLAPALDILTRTAARQPADSGLPQSVAQSGIALSLGVINGRNVWRADADKAAAPVRAAVAALGPDRVWVAPSCSLLHTPVDLDAETGLDPEVAQWLAFARQKCAEVRLVADMCDLNGRADAPETAAALARNRAALAARAASPAIHDPAVAVRTGTVTPEMGWRATPYTARIAAQRAALRLPVLPTTTIGSFPQTADIRAQRRKLRTGQITEAQYDAAMREAIAVAIREQEALGLDVLVHGEPERNDMVEYFGEQLRGFCITANGWVQSYGTRCVKPPLLYGDVSRPGPMTVRWITHAQSLTDKPVKGMLTGPVTIACWSFVRDDVSRATVFRQLALAIRDEVADLEAAGIGVIQIDEPALREGLPLRRAAHAAYLDAAVGAFRLASSGVQDATQIHTHMCYCDFHDIIDHVAALDADVISLEASRSRMELLDVFATHAYPNEVGPGVYDIHSPRVPSIDEMETLLRAATRVLPLDRLWANPDCGLKTRDWPETRASLAHLVAAAARVRGSA
ncbi:5-methyltetrahydropteroyltriglutamate--homocysteine S-methyltransferase [Nitratidesulfovibrio sp.]|uniref:5-methyltetrahydropteroyltriglutamate-- homocysteine S-methyltransferase n=1 Tax=Nitratidesulfovibrio sp. TaxID=2802297 RepID=UPI00334199A4